MKLPMKQYKMPDGRVGFTSVDIPDELKQKVSEITSHGLIFTCEILTTGNVALYISDEKNEEDASCEIAENGPGENSPKNCLVRMIKNFDAQVLVKP